MRNRFTAEQLLRARHSLRVKSLGRLTKGDMTAARMLASNDAIGPYLSVSDVALQLLLEEMSWQLRDTGLGVPNELYGEFDANEKCGP